MRELQQAEKLFPLIRAPKVARNPATTLAHSLLTLLQWARFTGSFPSGLERKTTRKQPALAGTAALHGDLM